MVRVEELHADRGKRVRHTVTVLENDHQETEPPSSAETDGFLADESSSTSSPDNSDASFSDKEESGYVHRKVDANGRGSVWVRVLFSFLR